jgi:hypothetical protein
MTERAEPRAFRYAWLAAGVVLFIVLWRPASWLAGLFVPVDWPTQPVSGRYAVDRLDRQINMNYWVTYGIWAGLWLIVTVPAEAARRRWSLRRKTRQSEPPLPKLESPPE